MERKYLIGIIAVLLGILVTAQGRSFENVDLILRDGGDNIFQELTIMKATNVALRREIEDLESVLNRINDRSLAIETIQTEMEKYKQLSGNVPVFGEGIVVKINAELTTPWVIDLINELFSVGAQAVNINNIRITNKTVGFDTLPQGQILINGNILSAPYTFEAIGDGKKLLEILELPGGIFDRMEANLKGVQIETELKQVVQID